MDNVYDVLVTLNLESENKARAFERLIKLFLKILLSTSEYADIINRSSEFLVKSEKSSVIIEKIVIDNKIIIDFINKFIFYEGETDK
ncbi:MAG: hypothetical protein JXR64_09135, partial [Spirochaetales bacterium]|nr:hypothetical protein [Spirochaetales bacterium]